MDDELLYVRFLPSDVSVQVARGSLVGDAAALAGIALDMPCGGQGNCGKCKVQVTGASAQWTPGERVLLAHAELQQGFHLACQTRVLSALVVEVPDTSLLASTYKILLDAQTSPLDVLDAPVCARPVALVPPTFEDDASDFERMERAFGPLNASMDVLRTLPTRLRNGNFRGTAIVSEDRLLAFVPGEAKPLCLAVAFDIGTTTLAGSLIDLEDGRELARVARLNPQTKFGDDILARITYAGAGPEALERLRREVIDAVNELIAELANHADARIGNVYEIALAGNTTMQHLLLGIDPNPIGISPFVPALASAVSRSAQEVGIHAHTDARCYAFPAISGYVGGDIVAGQIATRFPEVDPPALFIDIGTNGELVLHADGRLIATSCAAGPAFEGARITHGVRAAMGAIEAVHIDEDVSLKTIGNEAPLGICGSALIDVVAELLRVRLLCHSGVLMHGDDVPIGLPEAVIRRIRVIEGELGFVLAEAESTATGQAIVLYQSDIRQVQLATAAVRTAVDLLLRRAGIRATDLRRLLVAGAFGNYIRCENAQRMGLLPHDVPPQRIEFVGNTSLAGARLAATSRRAQREAQEIASRTEHLDLSLDPEFQDIYVDALFFPEIATR